MAAGKGLAAAVAVGFVLRLVFGLAYWTNEPLTRDEREYLSLARSLAAGRGLVYDDALLSGPVQPFGRAPGYPAFLALVGGGSASMDDVPASVRIAQSLVGAVGVLIVGLLAGRWSDARGATIAASLAAVHPLLVATAARAFSEALFWPMGLGAAWLVTAASRASGRRAAVLAVLAGVLTGLATLVRPATIVFLGVAALWWLWKRSLTRVVALALGAALVIAPWTVRASERAGRFVLVATEGGVTFWTGNHPLAAGDGDLAANPQLKIASQALRAEHPGLTEEQMEPIYYRDALAWMRAHPVDWVVLEARKFFYLVVPLGPSYRLHSWRYFVASAGTYLLLLPAAIAGAWRLGSARGRLPGLWLLLAAAIVTCLIFFPQERFRIPVIDPVLIVCAAGLWTTGREAASAA